MSHFERSGRADVDLVIAALRTAVGRRALTLADLSAATGIPRSTLARRLRGQGALTVAELVRLAIALDVPAADLLAPAVEVSRARPAGRPPGRRRRRRP